MIHNVSYSGTHFAVPIWRPVSKSESLHPLPILRSASDWGFGAKLEGLGPSPRLGSPEIGSDSPLTYFYIPKSARAYLFPQSVKIRYFCSGPTSVGPICPQPSDRAAAPARPAEGRCLRHRHRARPGGRLPACGAMTRHSIMLYYVVMLQYMMSVSIML